MGVGLGLGLGLDAVGFRENSVGVGVLKSGANNRNFEEGKGIN